MDSSGNDTDRDHWDMLNGAGAVKDRTKEISARVWPDDRRNSFDAQRKRVPANGHPPNRQRPHVHRIGRARKAWHGQAE